MRRAAPALLAAAVLAACAEGTDGAPVAAPSTADAPSTTDAPTSTAGAPTTTTTAATTATTAPVVDVHALRPPAAATSARDLAEQIARAEASIRDAASTEVEVAEAALLQQVAYRQLGRHPEWDDAVLAALPPELHPTVIRNAAARREFRGMHTKLSSTLPAWRIVEPVPIDELVAIYQAAADAFGLEWQHLAAVHLVETATGRIRGTSTAGAQGPMQFLPATWEAYGAGGDINDTRDAVFGAARYLAANNGAADIDHALFRYNHSQRYVRGVKLYAELIVEHPRAFLGYYHWGVWYLTDQGDVHLPVGYEEAAPIAVGDLRP